MVYLDSSATPAGVKLTNSLSWSHTVGANDPYLVVNVGSLVSTVAGITVGGQSMSLIRSDSSAGTAHVLYGLTGLSYGTYTVAVTMSSSLGTLMASSASFANVDQSSPVFDHSGTAGTVTLSSSSVKVLPGGIGYSGAYAGVSVSLAAGAGETTVNLLSDATNLQVIGTASVPSMENLVTETISWNLGASVLTASGSVSLRPKAASLIAPNERPMDPTTPSTFVSSYPRVVAY